MLQSAADHISEARVKPLEDWLALFRRQGSIPIRIEFPREIWASNVVHQSAIAQLLPRSRKILPGGGSRIYSLFSLQVTAGQLVLPCLRIRLEKSPSRRMSAHSLTRVED